MIWMQVSLSMRRRPHQLSAEKSERDGGKGGEELEVPSCHACAERG